MCEDKGPDRAIIAARKAGLPIVLAGKMHDPEDDSQSPTRVTVSQGTPDSSSSSPMVMRLSTSSADKPIASVCTSTVGGANSGSASRFNDDRSVAANASTLSRCPPLIPKSGAFPRPASSAAMHPFAHPAFGIAASAGAL